MGEGRLDEKTPSGCEGTVTPREHVWRAAAVFVSLHLAARAFSGVFPAASFLFLMTCACACYGWYFRRERHLLTLPGILGFFWHAGEAVACLKLSRLSAPWVWQTWLSFGLFFPMFAAGYALFGRFLRGRRAKRGASATVSRDPGTQHRRLLFVIAGLTAASFAAFLFEALYLGFVPALIRDTPHAYSYFHVTGVHYFTVSCTLVMPLVLLWFMRAGKTASRGQKAAAGACAGVAVLIPVLIVSRFFLIMGVGMTLLTYLEEKHFRDLGRSLRTAVLCVLALIPLYVLLTVFRAHSVSYLNSIFEMKNENMPIFITQPYMYIANNYENFNGLVTHLDGRFTYGLCQAFPVLALTGLKFVLAPQLTVIAAVGLTKVELTTLTVIYDAYHDFGLVGVILFGLLLGAAAAWLDTVRHGDDSPAAVLAYMQMAMYLMLSFFTTWFSNPTTWFWFFLTWVFYWFIKGGQKDESGDPGRRLRHADQ